MKKRILWMTALLLSVLLVMMPVLAEEVAETGGVVAEEAVEESVEEDESMLSRVFGGLAGLKWYTAVILVVLAAMSVVLCRGRKQTWNSRKIAYAAMCIAIAFVLSCIKLFRMPQGGTVTPAAMLPLILFTLAFGPAQGMVVGCAYGILQLIEDPYVIHPVQLLVDYPMAYGAMAVACLAMLIPDRAQRMRLPAAVLLGYAARLVMATISGVVFFAEYAGEQNVLTYSVVYNASYLAPEALIACALTLIPGMNRLTRLLKN